jgi:hypothetical protein
MLIKSYFLCILLLVLALPVAWSLPAPAYLSVPHWKQCVGSVTKGSATFVCLPEKKPAKCPKSSWKSLTNRSLIPACQSS